MIPESVKRYEARTPRSKALFERAVKVSPGGVHHNIRYYQPYPVFIDRGRGSHFWDVDGNDYVDYWMGHGTHILGHAPDEVVEALQEQVARSPHYGMPSEIQLSLGELIKRMVPSVEKIRFANTGTEATMYAVRFARAYTKRRKIAKFEGHWHGGHDILNVAVRAPFDRPSTAGALDETSAYTVSCPFNDTEGTLKQLRDIREDLACVIIEPVMMTGGALPAEREFLKAVKEAAESYDAVLIFDEVVTGFRLAR
ncbi:MAG: aminotransferase class III-fold pyridoxal phosphate-dependent enzyme, partial [Candidatus Bathyarchaeia archaeon]